MNSEFPMTFGPEESNKNPKTAKSNVVPLSRPQDSMLAMSSSAKSKRAQTRLDYAMSQFAEASEGFRSSRVGPGRWLLRGFLLSTLAGLWVAIGTGHLSSESLEVQKVRSLLSISSDERSANEPAKKSIISESPRTDPAALQATAHDAPPTQTNTTLPATAQASPMNAQSSIPQAADSGKGQAGVSPSNTAAARPEIPIAAEQPASNMVASVPVADSVVADDDLLKAVKILARQQAQLNEMEGHLGLLLTNTEEPKQAAKQLADLEARHLEAVAKLKQLRSKIRQ